MSAGGKRVVRWIAVVVWAAAVFLFSSLPGSRVPTFLPSGVGHFAEYVILGALLFLALRVDMPAGRAVAWAVIIASAYGFSDEFHQHFVVGRTPDPADWGMDTIGALIGAVGARYVAERGKGRRDST